MSPPISDPRVALAFDQHPEPVRAALLALRDRVYAVAATTAGVGALEETLKWGEPSYLTHRPKSGTTLRISADARRPNTYAMYVHCQSKVIPAAKAEGLLDLAFEGTRAVVFEVGAPLPEAAVDRFIALTLTYHRWKGAT